MSDAVIVLREECILAAEGKAGRMPKITKARRIPVEGFGNTMEQWKKVWKPVWRACMRIM